MLSGTSPEARDMMATVDRCPNGHVFPTPLLVDVPAEGTTLLCSTCGPFRVFSAPSTRVPGALPASALHPGA